MYPESVVEPRRERLEENGVEQWKDKEQVESVLPDFTGVVIVNSVCGCASKHLYPAVDTATFRVNAASVFAGVDDEATMAVRDRIDEEPSSPSIAVFEDGECVSYIGRSFIMDHDPDAIVETLAEAMNDL